MSDRKNKSAELREKIEANKRYLMHAKSALYEVQKMIGEVDAETHCRKLLMEGKLSHSKQKIRRNLGPYRSHLNGKGWKKLNI